MDSPFIDKNPQPKAEVIPPAGEPTPSPAIKKTLPDGKKPIPVTILTGYLGAGKTTVITNLMKKVPETYKIAWLKNEIGQTAVDTELASAQNTTLTKEMLQGCICHVMLGALSEALDELIAAEPDRIIIETSGSATPAPVVWEIREDPRLLMDGVVTVIDAVNFSGYIDKSFTLKMQARYTDLILINKHEELDEYTLDKNLDDLYEINLDTPKIKTDKGSISPEIIFGLDSTLFMDKDAVAKEEEGAHTHHQMMEVDLLECKPSAVFDSEKLKKELANLPKKNFYRIKGVVQTTSGSHVINAAFGDVTLTPTNKKEIVPRLVCMGEDLEEFVEKVATIFNVNTREILYTPKHKH